MLRTLNVSLLSRGSRFYGKCCQKKTKKDSKAQTSQATEANSPSATEEEVVHAAFSLR